MKRQTDPYGRKTETKANKIKVEYNNIVIGHYYISLLLCLLLFLFLFFFLIYLCIFCRKEQFAVKSGSPGSAILDGLFQ